MFDTSELERLAELVRNANIRELTLRQGDARITIRKGEPRAAGMGTALLPFAEVNADTGVNGDLEDETLSVETELLDTEEAMDEIEQTYWITAPLVGVFHHVKPLVGLGSHVTQGQVVGVIEAMKLINEITAASDGVVNDVLIEDGQAVEYGQPLFLIKIEP